MFLTEEFIKEKQIELSKDIKNRKRIYLDINYWGLLCDVSLGIITDEKSIDIYNILVELSKNKKIICPLSYRIYKELRKQKDIKRLHETAKIMDLLSNGVSIIFEEERIDLELLYFFYSEMNGQHTTYKPDEFVWTKIAFVLGTIFPDKKPEFSDKENNFIQKEFIKMMWETSLFYMIKKVGIETSKELLDSEKRVINDINNDKRKYEYENNSFKQIYMSEIGGVLDYYKDRIKKNFSLFSESIITNDKEFGRSEEDDIQPIVNMFYNLFRKDRMYNYLSSLDIKAKIFATIRRNKDQNFRINDLDDITHITTALPYYDYFFTENSFCSLVKSIEYDKKYNCIVESKKINVLMNLKKL